MLARLRLVIKTFRSVPRQSAVYRATMSSFDLPNSNPTVLVKLPPEVSKDQLLSFPAFKTWIRTLQRSLSLQKNILHAFHDTPYKLRGIDVQAVDFFGGGRLGFVKLKAEVSNDNGEKLPGSVFLRGGSVCMMVRDLKLPEAHSNAPKS